MPEEDVHSCVIPAKKYNLTRRSEYVIDHSLNTPGFSNDGEITLFLQWILRRMLIDFSFMLVVLAVWMPARIALAAAPERRRHVAPISDDTNWTLDIGDT